MAKRRSRGEGSIFFDSKRDLYVGVLSLGVKPDGSRDRRTIYAKTKPLLVVALRSLRDEAKQAAKPEAGGRLLRDYLDSWLGIIKEAGAKPKTLESYEDAINRHVKPILGGLALADIKAEHAHILFEGLKEKGATNYTRRYAFRVLRSALSYAVEPLKYIPANTLFGIKAPSHKTKKMETWTAEQCGAFLTATQSHKYYVAFVLAIELGMREGEILALHWADGVNFADETIRVDYTLQLYKGKILGRDVTKTEDSKRTLPMTPRVRTALLKQRERLMAKGLAASPWVVPTVRGGPVNPSNFIRTYHKAANAAGLPYIRPHDMRHSHATILLQNGVDIKTVSERLGHSTTTTTLNTYVHSDQEQQKKASELFGRIMEGGK